MSFGEELRRERELRHISLREISQVTKISLRYLEALERNEFEELPGGLFNRGFVRAYCQHIGVDSEAMVNAYLLEERAKDSADDAAADARLLRGRPARPECSERARRNGRSGAALRSRRKRWLIALVLAAVLLASGALIVWWVLDGGGYSAAHRPVPAAESRTTGGRR